MAAELVSALLDAVLNEEDDAESFAIDAVRQVDNPAVCLRQTVRFMRAQARRRPRFDNPDVAWLRARCAACGACELRS